MSNANTQLELPDIFRDTTRPAGSINLICGFRVYYVHSQRVDQVAYTLGCTVEHIYHHIQEGGFPNVVDISTDRAVRASYRIPRTDVIEFLETRKEGAWA